MEESTTIFDGTNNVSINTLLASMERNIMTNNQVLKRHKNSNRKLVTDKGYVKKEDSSRYNPAEEVNGLIKKFPIVQKEKVNYTNYITLKRH